jgi:hypothetical protein
VVGNLPRAGEISATKDVDLSIALVPVEGNAALAAAVRKRLQEEADQGLSTAEYLDEFAVLERFWNTHGPSVGAE